MNKVKKPTYHVIADDQKNYRYLTKLNIMKMLG